MRLLLKIPALILATVLTLASKAHLPLPKTSGKASYYGGYHAGKLTASGEVFNPEEMTCASLFYPMNTKLWVYYPKTNLGVAVRVNDRGPFIRGRILDLSEHAAEMINLKKDGVGYVLITPISNEEYEAAKI